MKLTSIFWNKAAGCLILMSLAMSSRAAVDANMVADELGLLPTPRQISLDRTAWPAASFSIVIPDGNGLMRVAADELNERITSLGGQPLPVSTKLPKGPAIIIGPAFWSVVQQTASLLKMKLAVDDPGEQGYIIKSGYVNGRPVVLCGGSDNLGALYAAVTLRRMIQNKNGQDVILGGAVRDWPAFKIRCNAKINMRDLTRKGSSEKVEERAAALRRKLDWCLRHKINYVQLVGNITNEPTDDRQRLVFDEATGVARYAAKRGIKTRIIGHVEIGKYLTQEQKKTAVVRKPGTAYMWSAHDAHRAHARDYARFLKAAHAGIFCVHPIDSGGFDDPGKWSQRPPECKKMYGDDRTRADFDLFKIYFDTVREECPWIELEAISYPYHYQFAVPEFLESFTKMAKGMPHTGWVGSISNAAMAKEVQDKLVAYHSFLGENLSKDVAVTFREAAPNMFLACGKLYEGHPVTVWIYPDRNRGWLGSFCPQVRYAQSFVRPGARDYYFVASAWDAANDERVQRLSQQEYLWNPDQPDADAGFDAALRAYEPEGRNVTAFQQNVLIPRVCRLLYGEAAPPFIGLVRANVSFRYAAFPGDVASERGENFEDTYKYTAEQAKKFASIHEIFKPFIAQLPNMKNLPPDAASWLLYYYKASGIAAMISELDAGIDAARKRMAADDLKGARALVADQIKTLPGMQKRCEEIHAAIDRHPLHNKETRMSSRPDSVFHSFSPPAYAGRLEDLIGEMDAAATVGTIPDHIKKQLEKRSVTVGRFKPQYDVIADGRRGEGGWTTGLPTDFFTVAGKKLARHESLARMAWDDEKLYLFVEAFEPNGRVVAKTKPTDQDVDFWQTDDAVEIFICSGGHGDCHRFAVSASGARWDAKSLRDGTSDPTWNGTWASGVKKSKNGLAVEMHIPFADLGGAPLAGDRWAVDIIRHRTARAGHSGSEESSIVLSAQRHEAGRFIPLVFSAGSRVQIPDGKRVRISNIKRYDETVTYGYSTFLVFDLEIETDRFLMNPPIRLAVKDAENKEILNKTITAARIPGVWKSPKPVMLELGKDFSGTLVLEVSFGLGDKRKPSAKSQAAALFAIDVKGAVVK
ncbi:MAG: hypothetical protein K9M45_02330 [Kiritimatiellales bacterium]|nr:hypothetical protein [Kiritimatiellales bacterium]